MSVVYTQAELVEVVINRDSDRLWVHVLGVDENGPAVTVLRVSNIRNLVVLDDRKET